MWEVPVLVRIADSASDQVKPFGGSDADGVIAMGGREDSECPSYVLIAVAGHMSFQ